MANAQAHHVVEGKNLRGLAEAEPIRRDDMEMLRERGQVELPGQLSAAAELAGMQQHEVLTLARFEVMRPHPLDVNEFALDGGHGLSSCLLTQPSPPKEARATAPPRRLLPAGAALSTAD